MYMYTCVCMYVCMCVYIYIYIHIYVDTYTCVYTYVHIYIYIYIYIHTYNTHMYTVSFSPKSLRVFAMIMSIIIRITLLELACWFCNPPKSLHVGFAQTRGKTAIFKGRSSSEQRDPPRMSNPGASQQRTSL